VTQKTPGGAVDNVPAYPAKPIVRSFLLDAVLVVVFAAIGRRHAKVTPHPTMRASRNVHDVFHSPARTFSLWLARPMAPIRTGLPLWAITVAGGMLLRWGSGQGVQPAFVIVAALVLLIMLVGWRLVVALFRRGRATAR
jgi:hypothetical protein